MPAISARTMSCVPSVDPVSTTTHLSMKGLADLRARLMNSDSFLQTVARQIDMPTITRFSGFPGP